MLAVQKPSGFGSGRDRDGRGILLSKDDVLQYNAMHALLAHRVVISFNDDFSVAECIRVERREIPPLNEGRIMKDIARADDRVERWLQRFIDDLTVVRSANTVRAHGADVRRRLAFCQATDTHPFEVRPRLAIEFIRHESERARGKDGTVSTWAIVRRLSAIRQ